MTLIPNVLTIAGSDSGGGAGVQADLKTFSALETYGASVITALTAQNTVAVTAIHDVPADFVATQLEAVFADLHIHAVKIGMLSKVEVIEVVADALERHNRAPLVLDPVMVAKSGDPLLQPDAIAALKARLLPLATVLTPNLPEAGALLDRPAPRDEAEMEAAGRALLELGPQRVLVKGGHLPSGDLVDLLVTPDGVRRYPTTRVDTGNTHGTGCTLSSALAALLARGLHPPDAVATATAYVHRAIEQADRLAVGRGHGPVHHLHPWW